MSDGNFISDVIEYDSFKLGKLNLILASCGSGKTTAAFKTIPQYLKIQPHRSLILINTVSGAEDFVNNDLAYFFDSDWDAPFQSVPDKPTVMTYALFGAKCKTQELSPTDYDYIVCDELHVLNKYIAMSRGKLQKQYPQATPWEINDMLQMTCFTYIALEQIYQILKKQNTWVFALTATADQLYKYDLAKLGNIINEVQFSQKLHAYEILYSFEYAEIEPILRAVLPENRKRIFYFNTIKELNKYKAILIECGRKAEAIWSLSANTPMQPHAITTREYVLSDHRFPDDVQDLLINSAYETAISIKDPLVKEAYIHTSNKDTREQARGRMRQDMEVVGYYNVNKKKDARKQEKMHNQLNEYCKLIPEEYFNTRLTTQTKEELIKLIGFPKKWTSLKKALINQGFKVEDKSTGDYRYSIIIKS